MAQDQSSSGLVSRVRHGDDHGRPGVGRPVDLPHVMVCVPRVLPVHLRPELRQHQMGRRLLEQGSTLAMPAATAPSSRALSTISPPASDAMTTPFWVSRTK